MLLNHIKTAWRSLRRYKAFSAINIFGLALGMTCSLLILLWVQDERGMDGFHVHGKQLYQVYERDYYDGKIDAGYPTQGLLAEELKRVVPEIQYASGMESAAAPGASNTIEAGDRINKMNGSFAGANAPGVIAISRKMATLFFGSPEQAIGKSLRFDNTETLQVSAVFEDLPANSSLQFDFLRSWTDFIKQNDWVNNWGNSDPNTYVQLRAEADPARVEAKVKDFIYRYKPRNEGSLTELALQSFPEKHLHSSFKNGRIDGGSIEYVRIFTIIAIFILLIACINFMNLATAQAARRAKEIGVRKVIGAARVSLISQFIGEALLLTFLSLLAALLLSGILLPAFNSLTGKQLSLPVNQPVFWLFSLTILLIIGMIVIYRQLNYIQTKNIGYDRDNLVYISLEGDLVKKYASFKEEAGRLPGILSISKMRNSPTLR